MKCIYDEYIGVLWQKKRQKWYARRRKEYQGGFETELEAANASDELVRKSKQWDMELNFATTVRISTKRNFLFFFFRLKKRDEERF